MGKFNWDRDEVSVKEIFEVFKDGIELPVELLNEIYLMVAEFGANTLSILDAMFLEQNDIVGEKLLKLWNLDPSHFMHNVHFGRFYGNAKDLI